MNLLSARGHLIYTIRLLVHNKITDQSTESRFSVVDMSGEERVSNTGATGPHMQESIKTNKSISTFNKVIQALARRDSEGKNSLPPYRDSQFTMLLKDILGGNCMTSMIVTLSKAFHRANETIKTLEIARFAKLIHSRDSVNLENGPSPK